MVLAPVPGTRYPVCIGGERACPPEDCSGPWGYEELLNTIGNPEHEEYEEMMEWLGGEFDPEESDLEGVNQELKRLRLPASLPRLPALAFLPIATAPGVPIQTISSQLWYCDEGGLRGATVLTLGVGARAGKHGARTIV